MIQFSIFDSLWATLLNLLCIFLLILKFLIHIPVTINLIGTVFCFYNHRKDVNIGMLMAYCPFTYSCLFILSLRWNSQVLRFLYTSQYLEANYCKESFSVFFFLLPKFWKQNLEEKCFRSLHTCSVSAKIHFNLIGFISHFKNLLSMSIRTKHSEN